VVSQDYTDRAYTGGKGLVYTSKTPGILVIVFPAPGNAFSVTGSFAGKVSYHPQENLQGSLVAYTNFLTGVKFLHQCKAGISSVSVGHGVETLP
jgi:hypothetical protein